MKRSEAAHLFQKRRVGEADRLKDQYFGTEIEMTGISRYNAAAAVGRMFGTEPYHIRSYDSWCVKDSDGKTWKFSRDSSIDCERLAMVL